MSQTHDRSDVVRILRAFIASELLFDPDPENLAPDHSLSALGALDSTSVLELIDFIEHEFSVVIALEDITSETFDTLHNITEAVMTYLH